MTAKDRIAMAERVYRRSVDRMRRSMTTSGGPFLAGVPCGVMDGREDKQYVLAGRILYRLQKMGG